MNQKNNIIIVAGVELDAESFPHLYRFAQTNPEGLSQTLKSLAKVSGGTTDDLYSVAVNLENDLAHG